jgi:hypothetical protein
VCFVRVRGRNAAGLGPPSQEAVIIVGCTPNGCPPAAPSDVRATVSGSRVDLSWNLSIHGGFPDTFVIEVGSAPGATDLGVFDTGGRVASAVAAGVPPGRYFVRIRSRRLVDPVTTSGPSKEIVVDVP